MRLKQLLIVFQTFIQNIHSNKRYGWKERCKKNDLLSIGKRGRPNLVDDEMLKKIKDVTIGSRLVVTVISRKMVDAIGSDVAKDNEPKILGN